MLEPGGVVAGHDTDETRFFAEAQFLRSSVPPRLGSLFPLSTIATGPTSEPQSAAPQNLVYYRT
jgi:hypothetical protein